MTHVLLISDTERVQRIFNSLKGDSLEIRTAATLIQADQEISASAPDFTFVQSRISGFSGEILLRHLKKVLPKGARIVVLAGDAGDLEQARKQAEDHLDLALSDEALAQAVRGTVQGGEAAVPSVATAGKKSQGGAETAPKRESPVKKGGNGGTAAKRVAELPLADAAEQVAQRAGGDQAVQPVDGALEPEPGRKPEPEPLFEQKPEPEPLLERKPQQRGEPGPGGSAPSETTDRVTISGAQSQAAASGTQTFEEAMREAAAKAGPAIPPAIEAPERSGLTGGGTQLDGTAGPGRGGGQVLPGDFTVGEPLSRAMLRESKRKLPLWPFLLVAALIMIPVVSYLLGRKAAPPEPALAPRTVARPPRHPVQPPPASAPQTAPAPAKTVPAAPPKSAPVAAPPAPGIVAPAARPVAPPVAPPSATRAPAVVPPAAPAPAPKPAATAAPRATVGLQHPPSVKAPEQPKAAAGTPGGAPPASGAPKALPSVVLQAKPDPGYGTTHPGWQRYLGKELEFKAFREGDRYQALQVLSRDGRPIAEQFFRKVLMEFGGVDKYLLTSSTEKGKYLVEQGVTTKAVSVTLYRNKTDHRVRAFVLYYR